MRDMSDKKLSNMTTPFPKSEYIELKDFKKLESEGKRQKDVLYIVHGNIEEIETMTNEEATEILLDMANELQVIPESKQGQAFKMALKLLNNENVLDKIRAEIIECAMPDFEYHGCGGSQKIVELEDILEIINKYGGEV